jgi:hypothetical protein
MESALMEQVFRIGDTEPLRDFTIPRQKKRNKGYAHT